MRDALFGKEVNPGLNSSPRLWPNDRPYFWRRSICTAKQEEHTLKSLICHDKFLSDSKESFG